MAKKPAIKKKPTAKKKAAAKKKTTAKKRTAGLVLKPPVKYKAKQRLALTDKEVLEAASKLALFLTYYRPTTHRQENMCTTMRQAINLLFKLLNQPSPLTEFTVFEAGYKTKSSNSKPSIAKLRKWLEIVLRAYNDGEFVLVDCISYHTPADDPAISAMTAWLNSLVPEPEDDLHTLEDYISVKVPLKAAVTIDGAALENLHCAFYDKDHNLVAKGLAATVDYNEPEGNCVSEDFDALDD